MDFQKIDTLVYELHDYEGALVLLGDVQNAKALLYKAKCFEQLKRRDEACATYMQLYELRKDYVDESIFILECLCNTLVEFGEFGNARTVAERRCHLSGAHYGSDSLEYGEALLQRGNIQMQQKRVDDWVEKELTPV